MPKIVDKESKRREIAQKAMELFARDGFANTPVRKITDHAGIGKGTLYEYFTDKNDILNEIVRIMFTEWTDVMVSKIGTSHDSLEQLEVLLREGSLLGDQFQQMMIIYMDIWRLSVSDKASDEFIGAFRSFLLESKQGVAAIIENAQVQGKVRKDIDPGGLAAVFIALIDGMCLHRMILKKEFDVPSACNTFFTSLLQGIEEQ